MLGIHISHEWIYQYLLVDKKSRKFIEIIEDKIQQETKRFVTNEAFLAKITKIWEEISLIREALTKETSSIRGEMASMKVELIKWNVGTIIAVAGVIAAIVKLMG